MELQTIIQSQKKEQLHELIRFTLVSLCFIIPIRLFIINPFIVSGVSMLHTFQNNDFLFVEKISYLFHEPKRGDVVVFQYPLEPSRYFIKRIIGLPGETVSFQNNKVTITKADNSQITLSEPYINNDTKNLSTTTVEKDHYFVMGDNREQSSDSRIWGTVGIERISGRPVLRVFPFTTASIFPGAYSYFEETIH